MLTFTNNFQTLSNKYSSIFLYFFKNN